MNIYESLDGIAAKGYDAGVAAERERIREGLDAIAERYRNAGVFAQCVVSDVRKLIGGTHPMTPIQLADEVERFNERYPVGTPVRYWPGIRHGEGRESVTRTPAWLVGGHSPCVSVEGYPGGIALTHIEARSGMIQALAEVAGTFTTNTSTGE